METPEYFYSRNNEIDKAISLETSRNAGNIQFPHKVKRSIQPIIDVSPVKNYCDIIVSNLLSNATAVTIYTTPTDRDFFLCGVSMSVIKDVTSTSTRASITAIPFGSTGVVQFSIIQGITLTAQSDSISSVFNPPIKLARGSIISLNATTNVANISESGTIWGFTYQGDMTQTPEENEI